MSILTVASNVALDVVRTTAVVAVVVGLGTVLADLYKRCTQTEGPAARQLSERDVQVLVRRTIEHDRRVTEGQKRFSEEMRKYW